MWHISRLADSRRAGAHDASHGADRTGREPGSRSAAGRRMARANGASLDPAATARNRRAHRWFLRSRGVRTSVRIRCQRLWDLLRCGTGYLGEPASGRSIRRTRRSLATPLRRTEPTVYGTYRSTPSRSRATTAWPGPRRRYRRRLPPGGCAAFRRHPFPEHPWAGETRRLFRASP